MPEMDGSIKPPQISEMFQKFAFSFKSKALEFFADDSEKFSLLDAGDDDIPDEFISNQKVVVNKPDPPQQVGPIIQKGKVPPNPQFNQTLITSLFASISSFEASYLQLQTAHVPVFDAEVLRNADESLVSHLQTLSEFKQLYKNYYQNPNFSVEFSTGSCLEFQVNENQHKLRALKSVFNRLQSEIDVKDEEVSSLRQKLEGLNRVNSRLSKRLSLGSSREEEEEGSEVLLTVRVFDRMLCEAFSYSHRFTKVLIGLMKKAHWDLDLVASSVYSGVDYVKKAHNRYALLSYVCLRMFQGFDLEDFGLGKEGGVCNGHVTSSKGEENVSLQQLKEHVSVNSMEILRKNPNCEFSKFCERKYQELIHPTMESSIFNNLDQDEVIINSWKSLGEFYESFVKMASSVWALHKLAFAFDPVVDIFQVERDVEFSMVYMEDVTRRCKYPCKTRPKVGFTVVPGFKIGQTIIQSQVYLIGM
ncbi:protein GRAVITROPIC IN THE LIGHT 1-like [Chenopodium quinoa]|uniref:protein GRAVITROPIC IN THE LIGHT 1-like n=1 Tax=Chenopodium quinoa TaxID=63459 RepID=UPI000B777E0B|nr:protein GRAVITROPIC IN THE LIGHT 1-like [Chenopodium quinoa]